MIDYAVFSAMNKMAAEMGRPSLTSEKYRLDILERIDALGSRPGSIIELGCCHGGGSALLAHACYEANRPFYIVDIASDMLSEAFDTVEKVNRRMGRPVRSPFGFCGSFLDFAVNAKDIVDPAMIIIDAGHEFRHVYEDACVANIFYPHAKCICFHDYALRSVKLPNVAVDKAFHFIYGKNALFEPLGDVSPEGGVIETENDAFYWIKGLPEGAAIWRNSISRKARDVSARYFEYEIRPLLGDKWACVETAIKRCRRCD